MCPQEPLPRAVAARAVGRCAVQTVRLLARKRTHLPTRNAELHLRFADGTTGRVFRETIVDRDAAENPCILVVQFRLRLLRGRWHRLFLWECMLNTPLFVGFPGFMSKLWVDRDQQDRYRGFYQWSDPKGAEFYARSLWRVLEPVCPPGAICYKIIPGMSRDSVLVDPRLLGRVDPDDEAAWWRLVAAEP